MTEKTQSLLLLTASGLFLYTASHARWRGPAALFAALAACALIREQDHIMDAYVFDGAWQTLVSGVLLAVTVYLVRYDGSLRRELADYSLSRSAGLIIAGFLMVFAFSRLFSYGPFWQSVMGEDFRRLVIRIIEEGTELFGYGLIWLAALEAAAVTWMARRRESIRARGDAWLPGSGDGSLDDPG